MFQDSVIECITIICKSYLHRSELTNTEIELINKVDADQLYRCALRHKLEALCYKVFEPYENKIEEALFNRFRSAAIKVTDNNFLMFKEAITVANVLKSKSVSVFQFKGVQFANLFFKDLSHRRSTDIDFAVQMSDLVRCAEEMKALGYSEVKGDNELKDIKKSRAYYLDYPWEKSEGDRNIQIEFHLAPAHKALYIPHDFDSYLANSNVRTLSLVDHALFVFIHHGPVDLWGYLMQLIDLDRIINVLDDAQISDLIKRIDGLGLQKFLDLGIMLLDRLFNIDHKKYLSSIDTPGILQDIQQEIITGKLACNWSENYKKLWYHIKLRRSFLDQLRSVHTLGRYGVFKKFNL